jgi:hypothetical protein
MASTTTVKDVMQRHGLTEESKLYLAFESRDLARRFERYLKSGSGHAFENRHLWQWNRPDWARPNSRTSRGPFTG